MKRPTLLAFLLFISLTAAGQESHSYNWTPRGCAVCKSTILIPNWYSDGSDLIAEGVETPSLSALAAVSASDGVLLVMLGFQQDENPEIPINPMRAATIETDSAPHMVLYPLLHPNQKGANSDIAAKLQFTDEPVSLNQGKSVVGCLYFPIDERASLFTVVATVNGVTFRFPFVRDPNARAKFLAPPLRSNPLASSKMATASASGEPTSDERQTNASPSTPLSALGTDAADDISAHGTEARSSSGCLKNISFAVAEGGQVVSRTPEFTQKWIKKNAHKYSGLCFSQTLNSEATNYVMIFSTSERLFYGVYPSVHTNSSTSTAPVSGSGTFADSYGGIWTYSYNGTATSTTTTKSPLDLPYADTTQSLFIFSYDQNGRLISRKQRTVTRRQGGEPSNTLGYNLGARLGEIHVRQRLLRSAVEDVFRATP